MENKVQPVPQGYHSITPSMVVRDAPGLINFLQQVFGGQLKMRMDRPDGSVEHAEVSIGDSVLMLSSVSSMFPPFPAMLLIYVPDVDDAYRRALAAGATSLREPANQFYGDRECGVQDAFGNQYFISTHVEDVPEDELQRRMQAMAAQLR